MKNKNTQSIIKGKTNSYGSIWLFLFYLPPSLCVYMCLHLHPQMPKVSLVMDSLELKVMGCYELSHMGNWKVKICPLEEQQLLFTAEPFLWLLENPCEVINTINCESLWISSLAGRCWGCLLSPARQSLIAEIKEHLTNWELPHVSGLEESIKRHHLQIILRFIVLSMKISEGFLIVIIKLIVKFYGEL